MTPTIQPWPTLPVRQIIPAGKLEYFLKGKDTSEQLHPEAERKDGHLTYQFYYNKSKKLIGYRFVLDSFTNQDGEIFPRAIPFRTSVLASYIPKITTRATDMGTPGVIYHDLSIRLIRMSYASLVDPKLELGFTYCILLRSKLDNLGG